MINKDLRHIINLIKVSERYESLKEIAKEVGVSDVTIYKAISKNPGALNLENLERKLRQHYPQYFKEDANDPQTAKRDWSKDDIDSSMEEHEDAQKRIDQIDTTIRLLKSRITGLEVEKNDILDKFNFLR